jgi:hypothetical protein
MAYPRGLPDSNRASWNQGLGIIKSARRQFGFSDKRVGSARSNAIFNRIFEQYARGADVAAIWKESLSSTPFKIQEVSDER